MKVGDVVRISGALWERMHEDLNHYGLTPHSVGVVVSNHSGSSISASGVVVDNHSGSSISVRFFADSDPTPWRMDMSDVEIVHEDR